MVAVQQSHLGKKAMIAFIAMLSMAGALSNDMYLPALPGMCTYFNTTIDVANLTITLFFLVMAFTLLLSGPISDKVGRRPVLFFGLTAYAVAGVICATAGSIEVLIFGRIVTALGTGPMVSASTALVKDCFEEDSRKGILALSQTLFAVAPLCAPVVGAAVLTFFSWRVTFWILVGLAGLGFLGTALLVEPLPPERRVAGGMGVTAHHLAGVAKNKAFLLLLLTTALFCAPRMSFVADSSYVYIDYFGLSAFAYSAFFALNAVAALLGPSVYLRMDKFMRPKQMMRTYLAVGAVSATLLMGFGPLNPVVCWITYALFNVASNAARPFATAILLEQQEGDTGSASSLINFTHTFIGCLGTLLGSLAWSNYVIGLGACVAIFTGAAVAIWVVIAVAKVRIRGVE